MSEKADTQHRSPGLWPQSLLGPPPALKEINLLCWALFCLCIVAPACFSLFVQAKTNNYTYRHSPVDFVYFYGTAEIANSHPAADIYDYRLQFDTFNSILRLPHGKYGPSPYPPFVPEFFRLFTVFSFGRAYLLWVIITLSLYIAGVVLLCREFLPEDRIKRSLILCFALAYYPFLRNTLASGQLSTVALFALALALIQERKGRRFLSGVLLALLLYKFTLLLLIVPMLLLTRRWKTLAGFAAGAGVLGGISTVMVGLRIWPAYIRFLGSFGRASGVYGATSLQLQKYVDLNSLSYAVQGGTSRAAPMLLACAIVAIVAWAALTWWRSGAATDAQRSLEWASALTWTMLANVYYPLYDSILILAAVVIMLSAVRELRWGRTNELIVATSVVMFAASWVTEAAADRYGVQLLTLFILALAVIATASLQRARTRVVEMAPATTAG